MLPADVLDSFDADQFAAGTRPSCPADARNRVLVALERNTLRGFAVTGPSPDPDSDPIADGELSELVVHPEHTRAGHGSRLLHASVDTLRADRFVRATTWLTPDDVLRTFLTEAGWGPDGRTASSTCTATAVLVKQVRLHTDLGEG